jgi:hypothetical protein
MMKWVSRRLSELLPIPYYHSIFTMPHSLNPVALYNKAVVYDIFFKAVSHALNSFAQDPRFLGAKLGFIGILHTWGQAMTHHVHLHLIVSGGGISNDGTRWVNLPYRTKFLFPVVAVSKRVRKRFAELLLKAYQQDKLIFPDELAHLRQPEVFAAFLNKVAWQNWNCYVKESFAGPEAVVKYIGRYTHRVAIANQRLLDIEDGEVTFRYKEYQDSRVYHRIMPLEADEFIRRFFLHIIPRGFKRIRHFGFMAPGCRSQSIELAQKLLSERVAKITQTTSDLESWFNEFDRRKCPVCQTGTLSVSAVAPMIFKPG